MDVGTLQSPGDVDEEQMEALREMDEVHTSLVELH